MGATAQPFPQHHVASSMEAAAPANAAIPLRRRSSPADSRLLQIFFLGLLLATGAWIPDFAIRLAQIILTFAAALGCQALCSRSTGRQNSWRSAFITGLGISLLLRADNLWGHPLAAPAAIGSKFVFRVRGNWMLFIFAPLVVLWDWLWPAPKYQWSTYEGATFPEDLVFQETGDKENFQARCVLRHPWAGSSDALSGGAKLLCRVGTPPPDRSGDACRSHRMEYRRHL